MYKLILTFTTLAIVISMTGCGSVTTSSNSQSSNVESSVSETSQASSSISNPLSSQSKQESSSSAPKESDLEQNADQDLIAFQTPSKAMSYQIPKSMTSQIVEDTTIFVPESKMYTISVREVNIDGLNFPPELLFTTLSIAIYTNNSEFKNPQIKKEEVIDFEGQPALQAQLSADVSDMQIEMLLFSVISPDKKWLENIAVKYLSSNADAAEQEASDALDNMTSSIVFESVK